MTGNNRHTDHNRNSLSDDLKNQNQNDPGNAEVSVNNPGYFDDDHESGVEDEITEEASKTENEGRAGER